MQVRTLVCSLAVVLLLIVSTACASEQTVALRAEPRSPVRSEAEATKKLIAQLGSDDFTKRRAAEARLIELGAAAFDDLLDAQTDPDLEIATQSQYLLHRVPIDWARPTDAAAVRELMTNYAKVNSSERREIIAQLSALEDAAGLAALSRIAHFELSSTIAKQAVLTVVNDHRKHEKSANTYSTQILKEIGTSPRDSAEWLRLYASQLKNLKQVNPAWLHLIAKETAQLTDDSSNTTKKILLGLIQFNVELSQDSSSTVDLFTALKNKIDFLTKQTKTSGGNSIAVMSRVLDKQGGTVLNNFSINSSWINDDRLLIHALSGPEDNPRCGLSLVISWVLSQREWAVLELLEKHYDETIKQDRLLIYLSAVARAAQDQNDEAMELAERAYEHVAFDMEERNRVGDIIAELGHHDWAEREWRFVIDKAPLTSTDSMMARTSVANWCLHDRGEDKAAAELLGEVCDAVDGNKETKSKVPADSEGGYYLNKLVRTQRDYFTACHLESRQDFKGQRKSLEKALGRNPEDPDVLIAMYRLQEVDDDYRERVNGRIVRALADVEQDIENDPNDPNKYNHYAWLVSNTQGDFDKAVSYSLKSLELSPDTPSYLDTLGRCYFAAGDLKNAIKSQRQAVKMHPQVQVMRKQLEMFEKVQAEKQ